MMVLNIQKNVGKGNRLKSIGKPQRIMSKHLPREADELFSGVAASISKILDTGRTKILHH